MTGRREQWPGTTTGRRTTTGRGILGRALTAAATLAALGALGPGDAAAQEGSARWSGELREGATVEIRNIAGDVRATAAAGSTAEVVATKEGDEDDFGEVRILFFEEGDGLVACAVWGSWRTGESCDHDGRGDRGDHEDRDIDVSVDFEIRLPAGVRLDARTVSGNVEARGLRSDVTGRTVSGDVELSTTGSAWGETVSGDLDLTMGRLDHDRTRFETVSGDITLRLPDGLDVDVVFESLSGDFESEVGGTFEREDGRWVGTDVRGRIGTGGPIIHLETVSGDARLARPRR